jgi:hypothetical protein
VRERITSLKSAQWIGIVTRRVTVTASSLTRPLPRYASHPRVTTA